MTMGTWAIVVLVWVGLVVLFLVWWSQWRQ